jgi:hypothetical protein
MLASRITNVASLTSRLLLLSALPTAPSCACQVARLQLAEWGLRVLSDVADAIVSELVTNTVRACRYHDRLVQLGMRLSISDPCVRIEVWDSDRRLPRIKEDGTAIDESGCDLRVVDTLSGGRWGMHLCPSGKVVWAEIIR